MSYRSTFIDSPLSDGVFLIGIPLLSLAGVMTLLHFNVITLAAFVGFTAVFTGAHHMPGFLRAYGTRDIFDANRARLILAPLLIFSLVLFLEFRGLRAYIVVLWFFNWWHTAKQNYGLLRIYERKAMPAVSYSVWLDLVSILVWHFTASELLSDDMRFGLVQHLYNLNVRDAAVAAAIVEGLRWIGIVASIVLLVFYVRNSIAQFRVNKAVAINKQLFLFVTYGFYFFMFSMLMEDVSTSVESFYHNTQYVFFAWIMQRRLGEKQESSFNWVGRLFSIRNSVIAVAAYATIVAVWGYLLGGSLKPRIQPQNVIPLFNAFYATAAFLHYYTDSFIWKARSRELSSVLSLKGSGIELSPRSFGYSFAEIAAWILVPIGIATLATNPQNREHAGVSQNAELAGFSEKVLQDRARWNGAAIAAVNVGDYLAAAEHPEKSIEWYERGVASRPDYADAYQALGHVYSREGNLEKAIASYEKAVALDATFKGSYNNLGIAYALSGDFSRAEAAYNKAIALDGRFADAHLNLAKLQTDRGNIDAARKSYLRVLELQPGSAEAIATLGQLAAQQEQFDDAAKYFTQLIAVDPENAQGYLLSGKVALSRQDFASAEKNLTLALTKNARLPEARMLLANLFLLQGKAQRALQEADALTQIDASRAAGYIVKAQILANSNRLPDAVQTLEDARRLEPENPEVHGNLGSLYLKLNRLDDAKQQLQRAVELDPNFADAYYVLSQVWAKRGDRSIEMMYLNKAVEHGGHRAAQSRLQELMASAKTSS
jgi:tetratricopeptide (TPR) repeat protein